MLSLFLAAALANPPTLNVDALLIENSAAVGWSPDGLVLYGVTRTGPDLARLVDSRSGVVLAEAPFDRTRGFAEAVQPVVDEALARGVVSATDSETRIARGKWVARSPFNADDRLLIEELDDRSVQHWRLGGDTLTVGDVVSEGMNVTVALFGWSDDGLLLAQVAQQDCDSYSAVVLYDLQRDEELARLCSDGERGELTALVERANRSGVQPRQAVQLSVRSVLSPDALRLWLDDGEYGWWPWTTLPLSERDADYLTGPSDDHLEGDVLYGPLDRAVFISSTIRLLPPVEPEVPNCVVTHIGHEWRSGEPQPLTSYDAPGASEGHRTEYFHPTGRAHCGESDWVQVVEYWDGPLSLGWIPADTLPYPTQVRATSELPPERATLDNDRAPAPRDRDRDGKVDPMLTHPLADTAVLGWGSNHLLLRDPPSAASCRPLRLLRVATGAVEASSDCLFPPGQLTHWQARLQQISEQAVLEVAMERVVRPERGRSRFIEVSPREEGGTVVLDVVVGSDRETGWATLDGSLADAPHGRVLYSTSPDEQDHVIVWNGSLVGVPDLP